MTERWPYGSVGRAGRHGCVWRSLSWRLRLHFPDIPWKTSSWKSTWLGRVSEPDAHARVCISHLNPWVLPCCARYCPNAAFTACVLGKKPQQIIQWERSRFHMDPIAGLRAVGTEGAGWTAVCRGRRGWFGMSLIPRVTTLPDGGAVRKRKNPVMYYR